MSTDSYKRSSYIPLPQGIPIKPLTVDADTSDIDLVSIVKTMYPNGVPEAFFDTNVPKSQPEPLQYNANRRQTQLSTVSHSYNNNPRFQQLQERSPLSPGGGTVETFAESTLKEKPPTLYMFEEPAVRKKKIRHVQIQTRKPQLEEINIQTDVTSVGVGSGKEFAIAPTLGKNSSEVTDLKNQLARLEVAQYQLLSENASLRSQMVDHETENIKLQATLKESRDKYDRLSVKSYRKIKELMTERHVLETELNTLKIQVQYLDAELMQGKRG
jgi:hypothetical protein